MYSHIDKIFDKLETNYSKPPGAQEWNFLKSISGDINFENAKIDTVFISLTSKCEFKCQQCHNKEGNIEIGKHLENLKNFGVKYIVLSGGNPLFSDEIGSMIKFCNENNIEISIVANSMPEGFDLRKINNVCKVQVEIFSTDPEKDSKMRGKEGSLFDSLRLAKKCKKQGITTGLSIPILSIIDNCEELDNVKKLTIENGFDFISFTRMPACNFLSYKNIDCPPRQYCETVFKIIKLKNEFSGSDVYVTTNEPTLKGCSAGISSIFISVDGKVTPCQYVPVEIGHIEQLDKVYINSLSLKLRARKLGGKCGKCEYRIFCGGCRADAYVKSNDILAEDPLCWI